MTPDISAETWLGAAGCARGSQTCSGTTPAFAPRPASAARTKADGTNRGVFRIVILAELSPHGRRRQRCSGSGFLPRRERGILKKRWPLNATWPFRRRLPEPAVAEGDAVRRGLDQMIGGLELM